jgi:hypothetical protein
MWPRTAANADSGEIGRAVQVGMVCCMLQNLCCVCVLCVVQLTAGLAFSGDLCVALVVLSTRQYVVVIRPCLLQHHWCIASCPTLTVEEIGRAVKVGLVSCVLQNLCCVCAW